MAQKPTTGNGRIGCQPLLPGTTASRTALLRLDLGKVFSPRTWDTHDSVGRRTMDRGTPGPHAARRREADKALVH